MLGPSRTPRVVVSTGFGRLHGGQAAREAARHGYLRVAITGLYPTARLKAGIRRVGADRGRLGRMLLRDADIPADRLAPQALPELAYELVHTLRRFRSLYWHLHLGVLQLYGVAAARAIRRRGPDANILHVLSGYGHGSITAARKRGMVVLVDHAIAHPGVLDELIAGQGRLRLDSRGRATAAPRLSHPHEAAIQADLDRADDVLVNSEFVKDTFLALGWPAERVHVVLLGIDDSFMDGMPPRSDPSPDGPLELLFAGRLEERKGADALVAALGGIDDVDWRLTVAGVVSAPVRAAHATFLADRRVSLAGPIARPQLRERMCATPVFVFPSLAEGSARVVFEALAAGCYVITTPNAGSIVQDGVHGALVEPGDIDGLRAAIRTAAADRDRVAGIGRANAEVVRTGYRQADYGDALGELYRRLVA